MLEKVWEKGSLLHCWWEYKLVQSLWKTVWRFLKKLKLELSYEILLLGIHPVEMKTSHQRDTYIHVHCSISHRSGASGKEPACQCRRRKRNRFDPWIWKMNWRREWLPTLVFLSGESHG